MQVNPFGGMALGKRLRRKTDRPAWLGDAGRFVWDSTMDAYDLRADEIVVLESLCREVDLVDEMWREVRASSFLIEGSQGQQVLNPLLAELRQHRALVSALCGRLSLPDLVEEKGLHGAGLAVVPDANGQRSGGLSRWGKAYG